MGDRGSPLERRGDVAVTAPRPRRAHLPGWTAILGSPADPATEGGIGRVLDGFVGDFGTIRRVCVREGLAFGVRLPENPLPMATWSFSTDPRYLCFVEGVFYDDYGSHRIVAGEDPGLAAAIVASMASGWQRVLGPLSGSFSGLVFDRETRTLATFVDRFGTRRLFWTRANGKTVVSTNLAALRGIRTPAVDPASAFQFLTIGFPIGERTLLEGVHQQAPASVNEFSADDRKGFDYWVPPAREESLSLRESVARIVDSMEECVGRISRRAGGPLALGLTGGHDSRVILASLIQARVRFEAVSWQEDNFNDRVVRELCARAGKEAHFTPGRSPEALDEIREHAFVYTDGQFLHAHGYTWLGQQSSVEGLEVLLLGFGGDLISGSGTPTRRSRPAMRLLALNALRAQMEHLSFEDARALLKGRSSDSEAETLAEWLASFERESQRGSPADIVIAQRLRNRNLKRVGSVMTPASQYAQIVYPYLDNTVLDVYFCLPVRFLDQRPHCYAGFLRFPDFGDLRAVTAPISLRTEARFPWSVSLLRAQALAARGRGASRHAPARSTWSAADEQAYREVADSDFFDVVRLNALIGRGRIRPTGLRKMQTLARFVRVYARGEGSVTTGPGAG
jgi:Glutamine amidotransferase domain/Asparagine synthase